MQYQGPALPVPHRREDLVQQAAFSFAAWAQLGVDGLGIADAPPGPGFPAGGVARLTTPMVALLPGGSQPAGYSAA